MNETEKGFCGLIRILCSGLETNGLSFLLRRPQSKAKHKIKKVGRTRK